MELLEVLVLETLVSVRDPAIWIIRTMFSSSSRASTFDSRLMLTLIIPIYGQRSITMGAVLQVVDNISFLVFIMKNRWNKRDR